MNGLQVTTLLSLDKHTAPYFKGIASRDSRKLPHNEEDPALYILNTDKEAGRGEHWCVAYYNQGELEFFDPFGSPPQMYGLEEVLAKRPFKRFTNNTLCVQNVTSKVCGHHCVLFSFLRCRGHSFNDILSLYDPADLDANDKLALNIATQFGEKNYMPI